MRSRLPSALVVLLLLLTGVGARDAVPVRWPATFAYLPGHLMRWYPELSALLDRFTAVATIGVTVRFTIGGVDMKYVARQVSAVAVR